MRIQFLLTQDLESPSGGGRYFPLARELVRLGHTVTIAALHSNYQSLSKTRFSRDGVDIFYVSQMHISKIGNQKTYFPPLKLLWLTARGTISLSSAAIHQPSDIIHICKPHPMNSIAGLLAKKIQGKTLFLDCDDYEAASAHYSANWQKKLVSFFEDKVPPLVHHVTTHNSFLHNRLLALGVPESHITDIPNGVDLERFTPEPDREQIAQLRMDLGLEGKQVVAFIGSLSLPSHPVDLLLDAFLDVHNQLPDTILLIAGGGEDYNQIVEQTSRMGLGNAVRFCGRIPPKEIPVYYRMADVIVDPVYDNETARGRVPLKLFESWISEVPFVSADVGDRSLLLGTPPAGILARPEDRAALAKCILQVLKNPQVARDLKQRGRKRVENYTYNRLASKLETAYQESLGNRD